MVALGTLTTGVLETVVTEPVKPGKLVFAGTSTELGSTISTVLEEEVSVELCDVEDMTVLEDEDEEVEFDAGAGAVVSSKGLTLLSELDEED